MNSKQMTSVKNCFLRGLNQGIIAVNIAKKNKKR